MNLRLFAILPPAHQFPPGGQNDPLIFQSLFKIRVQHRQHVTAPEGKSPARSASYTTAVSRCAVLHSESRCMMSLRLSPLGEREYSTLGGTSGYTFRTMIPSCSNSFSCRDNTFRAMPGIFLCISPKRRRPSINTKIIMGFHLPQITTKLSIGYS